MRRYQEICHLDLQSIEVIEVFPTFGMPFLWFASAVVIFPINQNEQERDARHFIPVVTAQPILVKQCKCHTVELHVMDWWLRPFRLRFLKIRRTL